MLLMPQTYMNDSGQAVGEAQRYLKIPEARHLRPPRRDRPRARQAQGQGRRRQRRPQRPAGPSRAHVGNDYARVRIGVGHPGTQGCRVGYVLHDFAKADQAWLEPMLDAIAEAAGRLAAGDDARFLTDVARASAGRSARCRSHVKRAVIRAAQSRARRCRAQSPAKVAASRLGTAQTAATARRARARRLGRQPEALAARTK